MFFGRKQPIKLCLFFSAMMRVGSGGISEGFVLKTEKANVCVKMLFKGEVVMDRRC